MKRSNKNLIYIILILLVSCLIILSFLVWVSAKNAKAAAPADPLLPAEPDNETVIFLESGIIDQVITIDTTIIQDGLNDIGKLETQEYYFTQYEHYTKEKKALWGIVLPVPEPIRRKRRPGDAFRRVEEVTSPAERQQ